MDNCLKLVLKCQCFCNVLKRYMFLLWWHFQQNTVNNIQKSLFALLKSCRWKILSIMSRLTARPADRTTIFKKYRQHYAKTTVNLYITTIPLNSTSTQALAAGRRPAASGCQPQPPAIGSQRPPGQPGTNHWILALKFYFIFEFTEQLLGPMALTLPRYTWLQSGRCSRTASPALSADARSRSAVIVLAGSGAHFIWNLWGELKYYNY